METGTLEKFMISLRPVINQAKSKNILKLSDHIKKLQARKTKSDEEKVQNDRKVERLQEEISYLQAAKTRDIVEFVLTSELTFEEVLKEENRTRAAINIKNRGHARISQHTAVSIKIKKFRTENEDWKTKVPELLKNMQDTLENIDTLKKVSIKKPQNKKKKPKSDEKSDAKDKSVKKTAGKYVLLKGSSGVDENDEDIENGSDSDDDEKENAGDISDSADNTDEEIFANSLKSLLQGMPKDDKTKGDKKANQKKKSKIQNLSKKKGTTVVKVLQIKGKKEGESDEGEESGNEDVKSEGDYSDYEVESEFKPGDGETNRSSFFVGGWMEEDDAPRDDNEQFEMFKDQTSGYSVKRPQDFFTDGGDGFKGGRGGRGRGEPFRGGRGRGDSFRDGRGRGEPFLGGRGRGDSSRGGRGRGDSFRGERGRGDSSRGGRGRGGRGRGYQGPSKGGNSHPLGKRELGGNNGEPADKRAKTDSLLHPSWAAKQNQKSSIQLFSGKKTTFDGSGDQHHASKPTSAQNVPRSKPVISNDVHPSWAAKQAQKPSIQPFQGTKIIFGDD